MHGLLKRLPTNSPDSGTPDEVCVVFLFPDASSIRYLARLPAPGARVRSPWGDVWLVEDVVQSGRATYTVRCVGKDDSRRIPNAPPLLARLGLLARRAVDAPAEARYRWRMRNYLP